MKQLIRCHLKKVISYNKREYYPARQVDRDSILISYCRSNNIKILKLLVLSKRLRTAENLHGKPYKPNEFFYTSPRITDEQYTEIEELEKQAKKFHSDFNTGA